MDPLLRKCEFPGCATPPAHMHHIVYAPGDETCLVPLCRRHHEDITILNGARARRGRRYTKLSDFQRRFIWAEWIRGDITPRRTRRALEWLKDWK